MKNKEWLATLSAEDFYLEFKKAEKEGRGWTSTSGYVIKWLDEERRTDERIKADYTVFTINPPKGVETPLKDDATVFHKNSKTT